MSEQIRIANALEHIVLPTFDWKHADCRVCEIRNRKPEKLRRGVVHDNKDLRRIEKDIETRRWLASGEEEPEAESDTFRYRERQKWENR